MPRPESAVVMPLYARSIAAPVVVSDVRDGGLFASVDVSSTEEVFRGHYPGFSILPGVSVLECCLRAARENPPGIELQLTSVKSVRFASPVFPGDRLDIDLTWSRTETNWLLRAVATTERGTVARVRLLYSEVVVA